MARVIARRRSRRSNLLVVASILIAACSAEEPAAPVRQDPVVVYAAFEDEAALVEAFDRYKQETGVLVIVRRGPAERIVNDLVADNISPPADLLMTKSVVDVWRAAEESALRPIYSQTAAAQVPGWAADLDNLWLGLAADPAVFVYSGDEPYAPSPADLTNDRFHGKLCLSSSRNAINRVVIATLLDKADTRTAEIIVRGWVRNLALPPFDTESELLAAVSDGRCGVGIASHRAATQAGVSFLRPDLLFTDVEAIGVARHARNPDGAVRLLEWLVADHTLNGEQEPAVDNVGIVAWHYEEAIRLAERARYP